MEHIVYTSPAICLFLLNIEMWQKWAFHPFKYSPTQDL